ncbi:MAG: hypothetical protein ACE1ZO_00800, partial [Nitrospirales bacterium]
SLAGYHEGARLQLVLGMGGGSVESRMLSMNLKPAVGDFRPLRLPREPRRSGRTDSHSTGDGPIHVMIVFRMKQASGLGGMLRS